MRKQAVCFCSYLLALTAIAAAQDREVSVQTELKRLFDIQQLPQYIDSSYEWQQSSYDTTGGNDDGFSGRYSFVRKNPDGTLVIFEAKGKGVINRIWMPIPTADTLDFYFDQREAPTFSISFNDLFSGKVYPFIKPFCGNQSGGYYCYLPIPFQNGCKIVLRDTIMRFYQIQCRTYTDDHTVKTFNMKFSGEEKAALKKAADFWDKPDKTIADFYEGKIVTAAADKTLEPGKTANILRLEKGGRILGIEFSPAGAFAGLDKQVDLKVTWDNEKKPAIYAPLSDFFGYAFGSPSMQSLLLGSQDDKNYCYFPMPFDNSANIELIYRKAGANEREESKPVHVKIYYSLTKRNPLTEGKLYSRWINDNNPPAGQPHVFLNTSGRGHYVGTLLQAQGLRPGMTVFFEGDDSTSTDGKTRIHGTGSEDYFNGGWYAVVDRWDSKFSLPLHGALDYSLPFARTGGYRLYLNDKISFDKRIYHAIEHGPSGNTIPVDYTSVALYYADKAPEEIMTPTNKLTKVYIPDTLIMFPQLMKFTFLRSMNVEQTDDGFIFTVGDGGQSFTKGDNRLNISVAELLPGRYKLYADMEYGPHGADISLWQKQAQVSGWLSVNAPTPEKKDNVYLGDLTLDMLKNSLSIVFRYTHDHNQLGLDRLIFVREK